MPKFRDAFADALARLLFDKPLADLDRAERAELNYLRALEADGWELRRVTTASQDFQPRQEG